MKNVLIAVLLIIGGNVVMAQPGKLDLQSTGESKITFEKTAHDFGKITEGTQATVVFKFKNTGNAPLILTNVEASCGCTVPTWSSQPIPPGASGEIKAVFDSKGRPGNFNKTITVKHNAPGKTDYLSIRGFVE